ncbi:MULTISPECIES: glycosyltransferase [unclassified Psychrobacter]|uniref:glycosyltransferase n=1 Tax=unclassified Psychrobacter TaxID=196806 RepID=UPI00402B9CB4
MFKASENNNRNRLYIRDRQIVVESESRNEKLIAILRETPNFSTTFFRNQKGAFILPIEKLNLRSYRQGTFDLYWKNEDRLSRVKLEEIDSSKAITENLEVIPYATLGGAASLSFIQKSYDKPLSITIFSRQINASGGKTSALFQLSDVLVKAGFEVTICAMWLVPDGPIFSCPDGVKLDYIESYMENPHEFKKFDLTQGKISAEQSTLTKFRKYLASLKSDFAYLPNYDGEIYTFFKENLARSVCYILGDHNPVRYDQSLKNGEIPSTTDNAKSFIEAIRLCDAIHLVNPSLVEVFSKATSVQIIPIPNSIPQKRKASFLRKKKIIAAGRMDTVKKHDELIEAFKIASERISGWSLDIYGGGNGPERNKILELASSLTNVNVMYPVKDLDARMRESAIHATTSINESFGLTIAEAMDIGIPVIARKHAGSAFLLSDGRGMICGSSIEEFAESLEHMMRTIDADDPDGEIQLMTENAKEFVKSVYPEEVQTLWRTHLNLAYDLKRLRTV